MIAFKENFPEKNEVDNKRVRQKLMRSTQTAKEESSELENSTVVIGIAIAQN